MGSSDKPVQGDLPRCSPSGAPYMASQLFPVAALLLGSALLLVAGGIHGLLLPIENAVREVDGVRRITGEATDGAGTVMVRLMNSADENVALQAVKNAVDALSGLPACYQATIATVAW